MARDYPKWLSKAITAVLRHPDIHPGPVPIQRLWRSIENRCTVREVLACVLQEQRDPGQLRFLVSCQADVMIDMSLSPIREPHTPIRSMLFLQPILIGQLSHLWPWTTLALRCASVSTQPVCMTVLRVIVALSNPCSLCLPHLIHSLLRVLTTSLETDDVSAVAPRKQRTRSVAPTRAAPSPPAETSSHRARTGRNFFSQRSATGGPSPSSSQEAGFSSQIPACPAEEEQEVSHSSAPADRAVGSRRKWRGRGARI